MPVFKNKKESFFRKWSPEMAYVLGFFAADGCMIENKRGAHFIEFQIADEDILEKIKLLLNSDREKVASRYFLALPPGVKFFLKDCTKN